MAMTAHERTQALLGRGYFPKEMPPPFQTRLMADKVDNIRREWRSLRTGMSSKARDNHPIPSHTILFDMARKGHARRTLAIPNPINQFYLTEEISKHWLAITRLINTSRLSVTKCEISADGNRAVPMQPLSALAEKRVILYAPLGAILQTDVLSFYHSIYTHAIPWALHGKAVTKLNRNPKDPAVFGNRIDALVRSCQDGQTIGIPVGPDTSRILSEVMLCAMEAKIPQKVRNRIAAGFRYIDDFFLCFDSIADAEAVLSGIREATLHFDLQLNASKTRTIPALEFNEETWPSEVASIRIDRRGKAQRRSLMRFFSTIVQLSKELPDESIATFAVRTTTKALVEEENWELYEAFLLRVARENSNCLDSVVKILCTYAAIGYTMSPSVALFIERIIADHAPYNHHYEVAWVLWLARSLQIRLSRESSAKIMRMENDICALLACHLRSRRLLAGRRQVAAWLGTASDKDLHGDHWMLIYEGAARPGWKVQGAAAAVSGNAFFNALAGEGVSFYDTRAANKPLKLPGIEFRIRHALAGRKRALLPGNILAMAQGWRDETDFEELGENYGDADEWYGHGYEPDEDDPGFE